MVLRRRTGTYIALSLSWSYVALCCSTSAGPSPEREHHPAYQDLYHEPESGYLSRDSMSSVRYSIYGTDADAGGV
jgi:hypothetical protein